MGDWPQFPDLNDIPTAEAPGIPVHVISVATPQGLVRGITHFGGWARILPEVRRAIGVLGEVGDWSRARYLIPGYTLDGWDVDGGIFLFPWADGSASHWRDPSRRQVSRIGRLLWVPSGWVNRSEKERTS